MARFPEIFHHPGRTRKRRSWTRSKALALTRFKARVDLVNDVDATLATHDPAVLVAYLGRLKGISYLHSSQIL